MIIKMSVRYFVIILFAFCLFSFSACTTPEGTQNIEDCYHISTNQDGTFSYEVTDNKGNILILESSAIREPGIRPLTASILEVSTQTGTGRSTNGAIYCDVEAGEVSEKFSFVLGAKDRYVFYVRHEENGYSIICQDVFDPQVYTQECLIDDPLVILDSFSEASFETEGVAIISYLTGDATINKTYITIYFP